MRYYNAGLGKFLAKDKLFSSNYYFYGGNDPLNSFDPMGLAIWHCIIYLFTGGPCTHNNLNECYACCSDELNHNLAGCRCPSTNANCVRNAYARDVSCRTGCRAQYQ